MSDKKPLSRQRLHQIGKREKGLCELCPNPSPDKRLCDACAAKNGTKKRHLTDAQWAAVDWSLRAQDLANTLGVAMVTVYKKRKQLKVEKPLRPLSKASIKTKLARAAKWMLAHYGEPLPDWIQELKNGR